MLPVGFYILLGVGKSIIKVRKVEQYFLPRSVRPVHVRMGLTMGRVIPDHRLPFTSDERFILDNKLQNPSSVFRKANPNTIPDSNRLDIAFLDLSIKSQINQQGL